LFPQVAGNGDFNGGKDWTTQTNSNFLTLTADAAFQLDSSENCGAGPKLRARNCWQPKTLSRP